MAPSVWPLPARGHNEDQRQDLPSDPDLIDPESEYFQPVHIPRVVLSLQDGEASVSIYPIYSIDEIPPSLREHIRTEINLEIKRGLSFPQEQPINLKELDDLWFRHSSVVGIMILGNEPDMPESGVWQKQFLGTFTLCSKYSGRSAHICTGELLVSHRLRQKGLGKSLLECMINWAVLLKFTVCVFDLIYETNVGMRKLCESSKFSRIGRLKRAGMMKARPAQVDAYTYSRDFAELLLETVSENDDAARYRALQQYLETGLYPFGCSRVEKSRIRASSAQYSLKDGVLMRGNRRVVLENKDQLQVALKAHNDGHEGINRTCSKITAAYHWTGIRKTVQEVVRNCPMCGVQLNPDDLVAEKPSPSRNKRKRTDNTVQQEIPMLSSRLSPAIEAMTSPTRELDSILSSEYGEDLNSMGFNPYGE